MKSRMRMCGLIALIAGLLLCGSPALGANVYINELITRPLGASEEVELYNAGPGSIDVGGWIIRGSKASYTIPGPEIIPDGGYAALIVGDIQGERGGVTTLIETVGDGRVPVGQDSVYYGQAGSAPLPPAGTSLARAPDAALGTPPAPNPATDGLVWTIALFPTFGAVNVVPAPQMGSSILINEFHPGTAGGGDEVEFYNPSGSAVDIEGYYLVNGAAVMFLSGIVPAGGFLTITTGAGFDLEEVGLLYLFQSNEVRIDQLGFHDAPALGAGECYGRCCDGAPPYLGYDYLSSGGGDSFRPIECSLGSSNNPACGTSPTERTTWGSLKGIYR